MIPNRNGEACLYGREFGFERNVFVLRHDIKVKNCCSGSEVEAKVCLEALLHKYRPQARWGSADAV